MRNITFHCSIFDLSTQLYPAYFLPLASLGNLAKVKLLCILFSQSQTVLSPLSCCSGSQKHFQYFSHCVVYELLGLLAGVEDIQSISLTWWNNILTDTPIVYKNTLNEIEQVHVISFSWYVKTEGPQSRLLKELTKYSLVFMKCRRLWKVCREMKCYWVIFQFLQAVGRGLRDPSFRVIQNHFAISGNLGEVSAKVGY